MNARMRFRTWMKGVGLLALALLVITGCRSSSASRSGGGGGGCCTGQTAGPAVVLANPTQATLPRGAGAVTRLPGEKATASADRPYGGQKTCPVMGEELGGMGPPIPVTVQGQTVYVCCRGCVAKLQRDPDAYLAKVMAERAGGP